MRNLYGGAVGVEEPYPTLNPNLHLQPHNRRLGFNCIRTHADLYVDVVNNVTHDLFCKGGGRNDEDGQDTIPERRQHIIGSQRFSTSLSGAQYATWRLHEEQCRARYEAAKADAIKAAQEYLQSLSVQIAI